MLCGRRKARGSRLACTFHQTRAGSGTHSTVPIASPICVVSLDVSQNMQLCVQVMIRRRHVHLRRDVSIAQISLCAALLLGLTATAMAQTDFQEVDAASLLRNPKNYWSLGIVFKDTLLDTQAGRRTKIGSKEYIPFKTMGVGTCYAEARLAPVLSAAQTDQEYLFRGTVLNKQASFFNRQDLFFVVVQSIAPALEKTTVDSSDLLPTNTRMEGHDGAAESEQLLSTIQQALFSYAERENTTIGDLFTQDLYKPQVMETINSSILETQNEQNTTAIALLGDFLYNAFSKNYAPQAKPEATVAPKSSRISLKTGLGNRTPSAPRPKSPEKQTDEEPAPPAEPKIKPPNVSKNASQPVGW